VLVVVMAFHQEIFQRDIASVTDQAVRVLQQSSYQNNHGQFEDRILLDPGIFAEESGPVEVCTAKHTTKDTAHDAEEDEDEVLTGLVVDAEVCLKEDQAAGSRGIELLESGRGDERAEKGAPEDLAREVGADFLRGKVSERERGRVSG
jgi:hypothetical protein